MSANTQSNTRAPVQGLETCECSQTLSQLLEESDLVKMDAILKIAGTLSWSLNAELIIEACIEELAI